jgi:hypothetical protein
MLANGRVLPALLARRDGFSATSLPRVAVDRVVPVAAEQQVVALTAAER